VVLACGNAPASPECALAAIGAAGPTWRELALQRSDLRWNSHEVGEEPRPGVHLILTLKLVTQSTDGCRPLRGARVDVWHCDAQGVYSGSETAGTAGEDYLRGYQISDEWGRVSFVTVYPGWYTGRAVHVHAKVRLWDPYGEVSTDVSTQLFFDDAISDAVFATPAYGGRPMRDTRNATDSIYRAGTSPLVSLGGSIEAGLEGSAEVAVQVGQIRRS
jgi:protocatechuate 3,4-dioxygenase beta subunit